LFEKQHRGYTVSFSILKMNKTSPIYISKDNKLRLYAKPGGFLFFYNTLKVYVRIKKPLVIKKGEGKLEMFINKPTNDTHIIPLWSNLRNIVRGLTNPFVSTLTIKGVGYKVFKNNKPGEMLFKLGFSHPVIINRPSLVSVKVRRNTEIFLKSSINTYLEVFAKKISCFRKRDPYKGKGILKKYENIRLKPGKKS